MPKWTAGDIPDQSGRTFLITGANSGLGLVTSLELARHGANVIMTARDKEKGEAATDRIRSQVPKAALELRLLDLADLNEVKAFADRLLVAGTALDVLVNNAGIMMPPHSFTRQGHELQFGVNHLAHFALALMLLERLQTGREPRIVTVSSDLHKRGSIHFDDLDGAQKYRHIDFYAQSKFANVLFALELDRRLKAVRSPIKSVLAHPGYAATNLQLSGPTGMLNLFLRIGNRFLAQSAEMGALNLLYAATATPVVGGQFIGPDGKNELSGYPTLVQPVQAARDEEIASRLWELSEKLTQVQAPSLQATTTARPTSSTPRCDPVRLPA